jgi:hypothetical protein
VYGKVLGWGHSQNKGPRMSQVFFFSLRMLFTTKVKHRIKILVYVKGTSSSGIPPRKAKIDVF